MQIEGWISSPVGVINQLRFRKKWEKTASANGLKREKKVGTKERLWEDVLERRYINIQSQREIKEKERKSEHQRKNVSGRESETEREGDRVREEGKSIESDKVKKSTKVRWAT